MRFSGYAACLLWLFPIQVSRLSAQQPAAAEAEKAAAAAEDAADPAAAAPATAGPTVAGPGRAKYEKVLAEWKELVGELTTLQAEYYKANEQERAEIDKKWKQVIARGDAMEPKLIDAAEKAYAESPNSDPNLNNLLLDVLYGDVLTRGPMVQTDNYPRALRIGKLLVENKSPQKATLNAAGIAALAMQDYETAEKCFTLAKKEKVRIGGSSQEMDNVVYTFLNAPDHFKKAWEKEQQIRQKEAQADDLPRVLLTTSQGDVELELFENEAPNTVASFISLIKTGFYDGLTFHRVLPGFMAQGGCPRGDGTGGPGYKIPCECYQENHRNHFRGSLAMAKGMDPVTRLNRDTAGSQFYITFASTVMLNGKYTVFGRVVKGFDVLHKIQRRDPSKMGQPEPDTIVKMEVLRDRGHEYQPKKVGQ